jgi:peptidoglycan hydrolase-like protein with peptidoglycan-binding domain
MPRSKAVRPSAAARALLPLGAALALLPAGGAQAASRVPQLKGARCVPATAKACRAGVAVRVGRQVQLRGSRLAPGLRVSFRWSRGALATELHRSRTGWVARVPAGTRAGKVSMTVRDRAGRRSKAVHIRVVAAPKPAVGLLGSTVTGGGALPAAFAGNGMWIWELPKSEGGDLAAIVARARAAAISTVFVKSSDGATNRWGQFGPGLVQALHAQGLRVCAWQFVYGNSPEAEAGLGASAVADGADCLVIDAEGQYEGKYAQAQRYLATLRASIGAAFPVGLTSFPYVDYHPGLPFSVFLGPGGAQANLPQVYWKDIGGTVDAVSAHAFAHNRLYGAPIAPLGQTYGSVSAADVQRFRTVWAAYGSGGLSWWSWQATPAALWATLGADPGAPAAVPDPGWPALGKGAKGDEVVWLQEHLVSAEPGIPVDGILGSATAAALRAFQASRGLPATGTTDAATWAQVLALPLQPKDWTGAAATAAAGARAARASRRATGPRSAGLPARRDEIPPPAKRR